MRRGRGIIAAGILALAPHAAAAWQLLHDPLDVEGKMQGFKKNLVPDRCPNGDDIHGQLTLAQAVILSICHNPTTRSAYWSLMAEAAGYGGALSVYFPSVSASAGEDKGWSYGPHGVNAHSSGNSSSIGASMTLYDFGRREASIDAAEQALLAAGHGYDSALQGVIGVTLQDYYQLMTAASGVAAAKDSEQFSLVSYQAAQLMHKVGQVPLADELQARGTYSQAVLARQQAENQLLQSRATLAVQMGIEPDRPLEVAQVNEKELDEAPLGGQIQPLIARAKQMREDLKAQALTLQSARDNLDATRRADLPSIAVSAGQGYGMANVWNGNNTRSDSIGISVSIPIFSGFSQTYSENAAARQVQVQEEQLQQTTLNVELDVWSSWQNYQTARQSWGTSKELLQSSALLHDVALARYKEGIGTILEVLNAQTQYAAALQSQLQQRLNLLLARSNLVRAVGVLNLDTVQPEAMQKALAP